MGNFLDSLAGNARSGPGNLIENLHFLTLWATGIVDLA